MKHDPNKSLTELSNGEEMINFDTDFQKSCDYEYVRSNSILNSTTNGNISIIVVKDKDKFKKNNVNESFQNTVLDSKNNTNITFSSSNVFSENHLKKIILKKKSESSNSSNVPDSNKDGEEKEKNENERENIYRLQFIRKVFILFGIQIGISMISSSLTLFLDLSNFYSNNLYLLIISIIISAFILGMLSSSRRISLYFPINYVLLLILTLLQSYILNVICTFTSPQIIFAGFLITTTVVFALFVLALILSNEFKLCLGFIVCILTNILMFGLLFIFFGSMKLHILFCILATLTFSFYLLIDINFVIRKGNPKYDLNDYLGASVSIYIDIVFIFILIIKALKSYS